VSPSKSPPVAVPNRAQLRDQIEVELSNLFQEWLPVKFLLQDAGVPANQVLPFGGMPPLLYWKAICQLVDSGVVPQEKLQEKGYPDGLTALVEAALGSYPGNGKLLRVRDELGRLNKGAAARLAVLKVLFLCAAPVDLTPLRAGREFRAIQECVQHPGLPVRLELTAFWAAQPDQLLKPIVHEKPALVHFCGHGEEDGSLALEGAKGETVMIPAGLLGKVFEQVNQPAEQPPVRCVVLNACHSQAAAQAASASVDVVTGTDWEVGDDAAIAFAQGVYTGLADGRSVGNAIGLGRVQMDLVAHGNATVNLPQVPNPTTSQRMVVATRKGVNPDQLFLGQPAQ
jgi:hypothetical protein